MGLGEPGKDDRVQELAWHGMLQATGRLGVVGGTSTVRVGALAMVVGDCRPGPFGGQAVGPASIPHDR